MDALSTIAMLVFWFILLFIGLPALIYICVKVGVAGFYRGKESYLERNLEKGKDDEKD